MNGYRLEACTYRGAKNRQWKRMKSRLNRVDDWESLAQTSGYSSSTIARLRGVSVRQFERYCLETHGKTPKQWLRDVRLRKAAKLLIGGASVKSTAMDLCYKDVAHFIRDFRQYYGVSPGRWIDCALSRRMPLASNSYEHGQGEPVMNIGRNALMASVLVTMTDLQVPCWVF